MGFDAAKAVEATAKWIRDWFELNGPGCNAIIGISGGRAALTETVSARTILSEMSITI